MNIFAINSLALIELIWVIDFERTTKLFNTNINWNLSEIVINLTFFIELSKFDITIDCLIFIEKCLAFGRFIKVKHYCESSEINWDLLNYSCIDLTIVHFFHYNISLSLINIHYFNSVSAKLYSIMWTVNVRRGRRVREREREREC